MKVSAQIAWEFDRYSITRGYQIYEGKGIEVEPGPGGTVTSVVSGAHVILRLKGTSLETGCNCQEFFKNRECRHIWAALLTAEEEGLLPAPTEGRVNLVKKGQPAPAILGPPLRIPAPKSKLRPPPPPPPAPRQLWLNRTTALVRATSDNRADAVEWPATRVLLYNVRVQQQTDSDLHINVLTADPRKNGKGLTKPRAFNLNYRQFDAIANEADRAILKTLNGARDGNSYYSSGSPISSWSLYPEMARELLPRICATGRCFVENYGESDQPPLVWEDQPWRFSLAVERKKGQRFVTGIFTRGDQKKTVSDPIMVVGGMLLFTFTAVAPIECAVSPEWISNLRSNGPIAAPDDEWEALATTLMEAHLPAEVLPEELKAEEQKVDPIPCLRVETRKLYYRDSEDVALLSFDYGGKMIASHEVRGGILQPGRKLLVRDRKAESLARDRMDAFKLTQSAYDGTHPPGWVIPPQKLGTVVHQLTKEGWRIDFHGKQVVQPSETSLDVTSGIDWFDLNATVSYGKHKYTYPQLLRAIEAGGPTLILPNGDIGVLPDEWIREVGRLASLGRKEGDAFRFKLNQAGLLDVLLADRPEARFDQTFTKARDRMKAFAGVRAADQPGGFQGQLRDYQREGVGWMEFLREFGFGGCLADDMGVGKTAQVLALLETRRVLRRQEGNSLPPSIAVVPRSLVFNWKEEAARFTPALSILDHTTPDRNFDQIPAHDLVIVTYGTLRRDIVKLRDLKFDYAILDEAQAIKNAGSDSAKAARLLDADHRLALSGTPVQNSLSDLWSLFQFLNPGMLGASGAFKVAGGSSANPDERTRGLLSRALRPLILRRTKEQVASELPPKVESILHCEMEGEQRKLYDELREHYRRSLLGAVDVGGIDKAKIMILEALLRLRQAACHPGLIDKKRVGEPSAKLDTLLARLSEVVDEGHKALVFSQFTSFLDIVRQRLDKDGVRYEYLDGATVDRQARVKSFENDAGCKLFLISLKAGGVGLNLVAADYVFLLDPWWNPAVEAQAIDRTHRIGQTRHVFAYRLIARDTVEEKVLALQESKRRLADTVINQDNSLLAQMGREELEYLLS
jgi:superfamily II DNA or RNA helicase